MNLSSNSLMNRAKRLTEELAEAEWRTCLLAEKLFALRSEAAQECEEHEAAEHQGGAEEAENYGYLRGRADGLGEAYALLRSTRAR